MTKKSRFVIITTVFIVLTLALAEYSVTEIELQR